MVKKLNLDDQEDTLKTNQIVFFNQHNQHWLNFTYSLLVCDVQLWFSVRLELILLKSGVDPSVLHDLLQN